MLWLKKKDQIVPLLFGSWKAFNSTSVYQEAAPECRAGALGAGVAVGRTARGDHTALTKMDRISCSPQEGELRTLTRAF